MASSVTEKIGNLTVEGGPDSYLPEKFWSVQLIKKVGLAEEMLCSNDEFKGTFIYSGGRLHPLPEGVMLMVPTMIMPLAKSSLISWPGKIRMGMELFVPPRKDQKDESLAEFVTRTAGQGMPGKDRRTPGGRHSHLQSGQYERAGHVPPFCRDGAEIRQPDQRHDRRDEKDAARRTRPVPKMTYFMSLKEGMQELVRGCVSYHRRRTGEDGNNRGLCCEARMTATA